MQQIWQIQTGGTENISSVEELRNVLLVQRGITADREANFFGPRYDRDIYDPLTMSDMSVVVNRLYQAIEAKEKIVVYGDYDADGVSSTAILVSVLQDLGAIVKPYIPHRLNDGYGLNQKALELLLPAMDLLVTVDCGISNIAEVAWLKTQGIETIIIDHHEVPEKLPDALAIVHPRHPNFNYQEPWLCGAGVSWKVAQALLRDPRSKYAADPDREKWLLDLVALGTIADVVPLLGENRAIVRFGLEILKRTSRPGIKLLLAAMRENLVNLSVTDIAYRIVPRINAAGRMDHALPALELLLTADRSQAEKLLQQLEIMNQQRQTLTKRVIKEAETQVSPVSTPWILAFSADWPAGIVGLAAGRLSDTYKRPAIVIGSNGKDLIGSARSPVGMNILELITAGAEHLVKMGGHTQAAGFTVKPDGILLFKQALEKYSEQSQYIEPLSLTKSAAAVLPHDLINTYTLEMLRGFAPWGEGNTEPVFVVPRLQVTNWRFVGSEQKHIKFSFRTKNDYIDGIGFSMGDEIRDCLQSNRVIDVLGHLSENEYRGRKSLQLQVLDAAPTGSATIKS